MSSTDTDVPRDVAAPLVAPTAGAGARAGRTARRLQAAAVAATVAVATAIPFYVSDFSLFQLTRVLTVALVVLAINLLTGGTGQISVGHGALFGIGAYVMAILVVKASVPTPLAVVGAGVACFACGLVIGVPALRIRGLYLGLLTLAIAILLPALIKHWPTITGGTGGLTLDPPVSPVASLTSAQWTYLVDLAVLVAAMVLAANLVRGRVGRAMDAVRHNELMAAASGVRVGAVKIVVFACSAGLAGVGGALYQVALGTATPDTYTLSLSLSLLSGAVIGGIRSRWGAVLGAAFVVYVPDQTASLGDSAPQFAYAAALLLAVYALPGGVAQVPSRVRARVTNRRVTS